MVQAASASLALVAGFAGTVACAGESNAYSRDLHREAAKAARDGDFELAWTISRQALLPLDASYGPPGVATDPAISRYCWRRGCRCADWRCAEPWRLAWLLGKSAAELAHLDGRCANVEDRVCASWLAWVRAGKRLLGESARPRPRPQVVEWTHMWAGDPRPWTVVEIGGHAAWAMLDTARSDVRLNRDRANLHHWDYEILGDVRVGERPFAGYKPVVGRDALLRGFAWGAQMDDNVPATLVDGTVHEATSYMLLGMNLLLRYDAACFSWTTGALHLGELGPCQRGVPAYRAALSVGTGVPVVWLRHARRSQFGAIVDTGAQTSFCKPSFVNKWGEQPFRIGPHRDLEMRCPAVDEHPYSERARYPILIGMDVLGRFDAFGWELNPLRMVFVPKSRP